jgi:hypothetical protein
MECRFYGAQLGTNCMHIARNGAKRTVEEFAYGAESRCNVPPLPGT